VKEVKKRSDCPISSALDIFGDKWSLLIIRDIAMSGKSTYGEFIKSEEKIASNILADRLALLEWAEIITKKAHPVNKKVFVYALTLKGIDLIPTMLDLIVWSDKYNKISAQAKQFAKQIRENREVVIKQLTDHLKSHLKK
jgi:DNA-binding HxlR family transcriptional regulator